MRISRKKRPDKPLIPHYKKNAEIAAAELLLLDEDGQRIGVMTRQEAIDLAFEKEFDLVEINPKSDPPVAKLVDFSEFKYQREKEARKQKAHSRKSDTKGVRLSIRISDHDKETKQKQAEKFLDRGDKVKIELMLRGRENARPDLAEALIRNFIGNIQKTVEVRTEQDIVRQGKTVTAIIVKK